MKHIELFTNYKVTTVLHLLHKRTLIQNISMANLNSTLFPTFLPPQTSQQMLPCFEKLSEKEIAVQQAELAYQQWKKAIRTACEGAPTYGKKIWRTAAK